MSATHAASVSPGRKPIKDWNEKPPELEAALQRMAEKCRKNAEPKVEVMPAESIISTRIADPAGAASAENTPALKWDRLSTSVLMSTCKRYQIVREWIGGHVLRDGSVTTNGRFIYHAYVVVPELWFRPLGGALESGNAAKGRCEAHLAGANV